MATTYEYLLRRKADLEVRMIEAQKRAQAPFEGELRAIGLALGAIERAGLIEGEPASFAAPAPAPARRGRRSRSTTDMILMVLERGGTGMAPADIAQHLERRWNRALSVATVLAELESLEAEGAVTRGAAGWSRAGEAIDQDNVPQVA